MTDGERDKIIMDIAADIKVIKNNLDRDYKALYGNGKPGIIEDVSQIKTELQLIKQSQSAWKTVLHYLASALSGGFVGWFGSRMSS